MQKRKSGFQITNNGTMKLPIGQTGIEGEITVNKLERESESIARPTALVSTDSRERDTEQDLPQSSMLRPNSDEEKLVSMSLIDASGKHLLGLMMKLEDSESSVMTACEVAKQITQLGRLKLDVYKAIKSLK